MPWNNIAPGTPGIGSTVTATPREVFAGNQQFSQYVPVGVLIDGSKSRDPLNTGDTGVLRAGNLMGKITASGKYRPSVIGLTTGAVSAGTVTSITVAASTATEVARLIAVAGGNVSLKLVGPPSAAGTVATQAITATAASGTTITISSVSLAASVSGSLITPADGSETILTLIGGKYGVRVVDSSGNSFDAQSGHMTLAGHVKTSNVVNYPADSSIKTYIKTALNAAGRYTFDDAF